MKKSEQIKLSYIHPDPEQPRQEFDPNQLESLAKSITAQGILVPLALEKIGDNKYLIIDGERRYRAASKLNLKEVPGIVYEGMNNRGRIALRFHIQEQHAGWSAFDKAKAIAIMQKEHSLTTTEISKLLGFSSSTINDYLLLLRLSKRSVAIANEKKLSYDYLSKIAIVTKKIDNKELREKVEHDILEKIDSGTIQRAGDIPKYGMAIKKDGVKFIEKMLKRPDMTPGEALETADLNLVMKHKQIMQYAHYLKSFLNAGLTNKANHEMLSEEARTLERLVEAIEKYVNSAGAAVK